MKPYILIDTSYYNFYRFFATTKWYNYSSTRKIFAENKCWTDNEEFIKPFERMWLKTIKNMIEYFQTDYEHLIFARDGRNVWRYNLYPEYKQNRIIRSDIHNPEPVFEYIRSNLYPKLKELCSNMILVDTAEADDIIAISVNYIRTVCPNNKIIIITGDHDLLQLCNINNVEIYTLNKWTNITSKQPYLDMMKKILSGDPSDNIPPIYKGCGKKTAEKLSTNLVLFEDALLKNNCYDQFNLNKRLVDFNYIPLNISEQVYSVLDNII